MAYGSERPAVAAFAAVELAGVALGILKLAGVIDWPWAMVLAPFWVPTAALALAPVSVVVAMCLTRW